MSKDECLLNTQAYAPMALFVDGIIILISSVLAGTAYDLLAFGMAGDPLPFLTCGLAIALLFYGISRAKAFQLPFGTSQSDERAKVALSSWVASFAVFLFIAFVVKRGEQLSRGAILTFFLFGGLAVVVSRTNAPIFLARLLRRGGLLVGDAIVIGPQSDARLFQFVAELRTTLGQEPNVVLFDIECCNDRWPNEVARIIDHARAFAHGSGPGNIFIVGGRLQRARLESVLAGLAAVPRSVCVVPDSDTASLLRQRVTAVGNSLAVETQSAPHGSTQRVVKRVGDVFMSAFAIVFLAPLLVGIAIAIKLDSAGPVLFRQLRTGHRGRQFKIFKFRTMTVQEDGRHVIQARKGDKRVTRLGNFLRRSSLDELPQLFNVLIGDMSLVGPRPHAVAHDEFYAQQLPSYTLRQHVLPGITGWAQVNGLRGETSTIDVMRSRVEHDIWYVMHSNLALDIKILARTVLEVLRGRNAY